MTAYAISAYECQALTSGQQKHTFTLLSQSHSDLDTQFIFISWIRRVQHQEGNIPKKKATVSLLD